MMSYDRFVERNAAHDVPAASLRDIFSVLFKHWRAMAAIIVVAIVGATAYVLLVSPSYTATTKILVKIGREQFSALDVAKQPALGVMVNERVQDIDNEVEILRDPVIIDRVFDTLEHKLTEIRPSAPPETLLQWIKFAIKEVKTRISSATRFVIDEIKQPFYAIGLLEQTSPELKLKRSFAASVGASEIKDTDVIILSFSWSDPEFAAFAVNAYADEYRRQHVRVHSREKGSMKFYEDQEARVRLDMSQLDKQIDDFLSAAGVNDLVTEKQATIAFITSLEGQQNQSHIEQAEIHDRMDSYDHKSTFAWPETPAGTPDTESGLTAFDHRYVDLIGRRNALLSHYEPTAPEVTDIDRQVATLRSQKLQSLKAYFGDRERGLAEGDVERNKKLAEKHAYLDRLRDLTLQYETLRDHRAALEAQLAEYRRKLEELRVSEGLNDQDFASVAIISAATPENLIVGPRKSLIIGLAALFGVLGALGFALVKEFFDHTFRSERDVARVLGVPLIASIPLARTSRD